MLSNVQANLYSFRADFRALGLICNGNQAAACGVRDTLPLAGISRLQGLTAVHLLWLEDYPHTGLCQHGRAYLALKARLVSSVAAPEAALVHPF